MKFDSTRAMKVIDGLGDPRFAGAGGEAQVADAVAEQFAAMGYQVERLALAGSPWPRWLGPWVGWLGYGCMITSAFGLILLDRVGASVLALLFLLCGGTLFQFLIHGGIRPGCRWPPFGSAPVVIASLPSRSPAPVKVVFQAPLRGLRPSLFHVILKNKYHDLSWINLGLALCLVMVLFVRFSMWYRPGRMVDLVAQKVLLRSLSAPILTFNWIVILSVLAWEYSPLRSRARLDPPERRGLAVLLELARGWRRDPSRPPAPIFVVAGGQQLDHAGSREIARRFQHDPASQPSLIILLFAPGAGELLWLSTRDTFIPSTTDGLARAAAQSLWIPCQVVHESTLLPFWPIADRGPVVALMGSDPRAYPGGATDPKALQHAAQLATEIALRWGKLRQVPVTGTAASAT